MPSPLLEANTPLFCRYIVPNSRMGSVIGKAGSKIKEIQEASGAKLQASEAMLTGSTEVGSFLAAEDWIHTNSDVVLACISGYCQSPVLQTQSTSRCTTSVQFCKKAKIVKHKTFPTVLQQRQGTLSVGHRIHLRQDRGDLQVDLLTTLQALLRHLTEEAMVDLRHTA